MVSGTGTSVRPGPERRELALSSLRFRPVERGDQRFELTCRFGVVPDPPEHGRGLPAVGTVEAGDAQSKP
jgi:hypothetical protein